MQEDRRPTCAKVRAARGWPLALGLCTVAAATSIAAKPGTPGAAWFEGVFERVGRSEGGTALLNDRMRVVAHGAGLAFRACDGQPLALMSFGPAFEIENLLSGQTGGGAAIDCLFNSDGLGRPLVTCQAEDGMAFTLFSLPKETEGCAG